MEFFRTFFLLSFALNVCNGLHTAGHDGPIVKTKVGEIRGVYKISEFNGKLYTVNRFLGIRYGKPPVADLRFQKPVPYGNFSEPLEATKAGPACPQVDMMKLGSSSKNEDCLFLNILIPTAPADKESGYPVIVFIHGGGFSFGSGRRIPGDLLAAVANVIIVTFNYRVGFFGFLNTGDGQAPGNAGLWDQRLVFQWVKDNIKAFGGDENRITLLGDAAGSISALIHGMYPPNKGLFQNIIAVSGSVTMPFGLRENNLDSARFVADLIMCHPDDLDLMMLCFRDSDIETIMKRFRKASKDQQKWRWMHFAPTIDGDLIKRDFREIVEESKTTPLGEVDFFRTLGFMSGVNSGEGGLWLINQEENMQISRDDLVKQYVPNTLPMLFHRDRTFSDAIVQTIVAEYTDWSNVTDARRMYVKFMGDINFNVPATEISMLHADNGDSKTWIYRFEAVPSKHMMNTPSYLKLANHGDVIAPLFGFPKNLSMGNFREDKEYEAWEWELRMSGRMMRYVGNFARNGDPNPSVERPNWPKYELDTQYFIRFMRNDTIGQYAYLRELNFWRNLVPALLEELGSRGQEPSSDRTTEAKARQPRKTESHDESSSHDDHKHIDPRDEL